MIEVNDYVRTKDGTIGKVIKVLSNRVFLNSLGYAVLIKDIVKHSKQLIDLVEVGDYVNGKLIHKIDKGTNYCYLYYGNCKTFVNYQIKSIVTHEQMASIEYKVEEDK